MAGERFASNDRVDGAGADIDDDKVRIGIHKSQQKLFLCLSEATPLIVFKDKNRLKVTPPEDIAQYQVKSK